MGLRSVFLDWVSVSQNHPGAPEFTEGRVLRIDSDGAIDWETGQSVQVVGSWDSSLRVRSWQGRVSVSGNIGRWGRQDNLFGYGLDECMARLNLLMDELGLPQFVRAERRLVPGVGFEWVCPDGLTPARFSRLDVTGNFAAGHAAADVLAWLGSQQPGRCRARVYGDGGTVEWGAGSRYTYFKAYDKGAEILRHGGPSELVEYCRDVGLVRFELSLKGVWCSRYRAVWGSVTDEELEKLLMDKVSAVVGEGVEVRDMLQIPMPYLGTLLLWEQGVDVVSRMSRTTFYRHRAFLRRFGVDIAVPRSSVTRVWPVKVLRLERVEPPAWYLEREAA
jgi:hypothetical protein